MVVAHIHICRPKISILLFPVLQLFRKLILLHENCITEREIAEYLHQFSPKINIHRALVDQDRQIRCFGMLLIIVLLVVWNIIWNLLGLFVFRKGVVLICFLCDLSLYLILFFFRINSCLSTVEYFNLVWFENSF